MNATLYRAVVDAIHWLADHQEQHPETLPILARLKAAEKRRGLPEWHLLREALHAYGLI